MLERLDDRAEHSWPNLLVARSEWKTLRVEIDDLRANLAQAEARELALRDALELMFQDWHDDFCYQPGRVEVFTDCSRPICAGRREDLDATAAPAATEGDDHGCFCGSCPIHGDHILGAERPTIVIRGPVGVAATDPDHAERLREAAK